LDKYGYSPARQYQLVHDGKTYDSKAIVGVAFGYQFPERGPLHHSEFSGGEATVAPLLQQLGFDIKTIQERSQAGGAERTNPVQFGLENFLATYASTRSTIPFGRHRELKNSLNQLRSALEALPAVRARSRIRVSWSLGQGSYAVIPWIAIMDERETTSTQRGTYCVFLFPEDMSGVYLALNQGTTDTIQQNGRSEGRRILRQQAEAMRQIVGPQLRSFSLVNDIDLRTEGDRGQDYEASTVAYRYYATDDIPGDAVVNDNLQELLTAYDELLRQRPTVQRPVAQWWIFQANPKIYNIDEAVHDLSELTWTVKHEATQAAVGDCVFFWRAGREAGIIALGTIIEPSMLRPNLPSEDQYILDAERLGGTQSRVLARIDRRLDEPLLRTAIAADPRLKDLMILRFANYSTFKVPPHHVDALLELIDNIEQPAPGATAEKGRRVWVYAPGANAEFWDEFYEGGGYGDRLGWAGRSKPVWLARRCALCSSEQI
jgi:hypothetical protein